MIKLTPVHGIKGIKHQYVIETNEPATVVSSIFDNGNTISCVYRGTNIDEYEESVGAYDSTIPNRGWESPGSVPAPNAGTVFQKNTRNLDKIAQITAHIRDLLENNDPRDVWQQAHGLTLMIDGLLIAEGLEIDFPDYGLQKAINEPDYEVHATRHHLNMGEMEEDPFTPRDEDVPRETPHSYPPADEANIPSPVFAEEEETYPEPASPDGPLPFEEDPLEVEQALRDVR